MIQIRGWYLIKFSDLRQRIEAPESHGLLGLGLGAGRKERDRPALKRRYETEWHQVAHSLPGQRLAALERAMAAVDRNPGVALRELQELPQEIRSQPEVIGLMVLCHFKLGTLAANERQDLSAAVRHLEQAASLDPGNAQVREQLDVARRMRDDLPHAEVFKEAIQLWEQGHVRQALEVASWIPESFGEYDQVRKFMAACCNHLGVEAADRRKFTTAVEYLQRAIALQPDDATIAENLKTAELALKIVATVPKLPRTRGWLGRLFNRLGHAKPSIGPDANADSAIWRQSTQPVSLRRSGSPEVPGGMVDRVHFSVTSPPAVLPGTPFVIDVWAYLEHRHEVVIQRDREAVGGGEIRIQSKGPVQVARGTILSVRLKLEGFIVEEPEDTILWDGEIGNATFPVMVPKDAKEGPRHGLAAIHIDGLQIARVHFVTQVGRPSLDVDRIPAREERHRKAFSSYASADRDKVLARIQGIQKAAPELDVSLDVLSLRSGQYWEQEL